MSICYFYLINFYLCISDKHEFAFNIISTNKNVNKVDSPNKENLINDESDIRIDNLQGIYYISYMFKCYYIY